MEDGIRIRKIIFDQLMAKDNNNRRNWEMLCCSGQPLVPFIGAGVSAWCYLTWSELLKKVVEEHFSKMCADIVQKALACKEKPHLKEKDRKFYWMEEIAECIFDDDEDSYKRNKEIFAIDTSQEKSEEDEILQQLRDNIGDEGIKKKKAAVKALYDLFNHEHVKEGRKMPEYQNYFQRVFSDILITTNYDRALECCYSSIFSYTYKDLVDDAGGKDSHSENPGSGTVQADAGGAKKPSWLFLAVKAKLEQMQNKLNGKAVEAANVTVPDIPMLLKVHGSLENVNGIALATTGYEKVYRDEMKQLLQEFFLNSTLIFLGSGLREDRFLDEMKRVKNEYEKKGSGWPAFSHFAFLDELDDEEEQKKRSQLLETNYGIYPIFYNKNDLADLFIDKEERERNYHDYFLGLLLENLSRRKMYYPQPLELLWDSSRFKNVSLKKHLEMTAQEVLGQRDPNYVHRTESLQIWRLLNSSEECPLIAITGSTGSGKSKLCEGIQELNRNYKDTLQFFYISLSHCKRWDEFCIRLFQKLNIIQTSIPRQEEWRKAAEAAAERCGGYWRSVLILDQLDALKDTGDPELWDIIKKILRYWKEHQTRVIFVCQDYPNGIPCYVWHIGKLKEEEARMVFFSACTSKRYRNISIQEQNAVGELFTRHVFQAASIHLMGRYANSKNDLNSLLEEWDLYYHLGDREEQTLARILWHHLLEEHKYDEDPVCKGGSACEEAHKHKYEGDSVCKGNPVCEEARKREQKEDMERKKKERQKKVREHILRIWGILSVYPGMFPSVFFDNILKGNNDVGLEEDLSKKTLIYMKNAGLCEESGDRQGSVLLNNMVLCVEQYFLAAEEIKGLGISAVEERKGTDPKIPADSAGSRRDPKAEDYGLESFRGYFMEDYVGELRKYLVQKKEQKEQKKGQKERKEGQKEQKEGQEERKEEQKEQKEGQEERKEEQKEQKEEQEERKEEQKEQKGQKEQEEKERREEIEHPEYYVLKILQCLGKKCNSDAERRNHKELNLVLHYEIKTVIRFLMDLLLRGDLNEKWRAKAVETGYLFSHYYHYVPNDAYSLVSTLLRLMDDAEENELFKLAKMNRVMGDIQRLMGRKKEADDYYKRSIDLCNRQMLISYGDPDQEKSYHESLRIKAGTIVISNGYDGLLGIEEKKSSPKQIYIRIEDHWGEAYYNQRMGEMLFVDTTQKRVETDNNKEQERRKKEFDKIRRYFNESADLYGMVESMTGTTYILKCMGDLITEYKDIYGDGYACIEKEAEGFSVYFQIIEKDAVSVSNGKTAPDGWLRDAVRCYKQAFVYYGRHINWRGFANVLQAMGTVYRAACGDKHIDVIGTVEKLYGLAEECYRWMGDVRGLADTLDYFGYAYEECEIERRRGKIEGGYQQYKYMALSKWMESREIWKEQGNDEKADKINKAIRKLQEMGIQAENIPEKENGSGGKQEKHGEKTRRRRRAKAGTGRNGRAEAGRGK